MNTLVWETKADKIYQCEVHRVGDYKGRLTVINTVDKSTVLDTEVTLSFNAIFSELLLFWTLLDWSLELCEW